MDNKRKKQMDDINITYSIEVITPHQAELWLQRNESNRNIRKNLVVKYARAIQAGNWHLTGDGVSLSENGNLLDGQHRLTAIVQTGMPVRMGVFRKVPERSQQYKDSGAVRTVADGLRMYNNEIHGSLVAAVCKLLHIFDTGAMFSLDYDETVSIYDQYQESFKWMQESIPKIKGVIRTAPVLAPIVWAHANGMEEEAEAFWSGLSTGENLQKGSSILLLRRTFEHRVSGRSRMDRLHLAALTLSAMSLFCSNNTKQSSLVVSPVGYDYFAKIFISRPGKRDSSFCQWGKGCGHKHNNKKEQAVNLCSLHQSLRTKKKRS